MYLSSQLLHFSLNQDFPHPRFWRLLKPPPPYNCTLKNLQNSECLKNIVVSLFGSIIVVFTSNTGQRMTMMLRLDRDFVMYSHHVPFPVPPPSSVRVPLA